LDDTVTCLVRGPASRYPRGFAWLIPAWFVIVSAFLIGVGAHASGKMPLWLGITEIGGLAVAAFIAFCALATSRQRAFRASTHGIWLGVLSERRRPKLRQVHLSWPDVAQLRMVPRHYGVLLEITLSPAARIVHRPGVARQAVQLLGSLVMPVGYGRGRPALTTSTGHPPRYRVKICDVTPPDLRRALAAVQPGTVPMRVLIRKGGSRLTMPVPRSTVSGQPPAPVG
jgi:hypothetical protein